MMARADVSPSAAEVAAETLERRITASLVALLLRQLLANGSILLGNILLSRWLSTDLYGLFAATLAFQASLVIIADAGLGPALIQRRHEPAPSELAGLFTLQLGLFVAIALAVWVLAPWIQARAGLPQGSTGLVRALAAVLVLSAFRSIPALMLERELRLDAIAIAETSGVIVYQLTLLVLVYLGFGITSLVIALAVRYTADLLLILYFRPWRPRLTHNVRPLWPYVRFGLNMQGVRLLALARDQLPLLLLVPLLGAASAGYWGWALAYVGIPVYLSRVIDRVMFPAYARAQHDRTLLGALIAKALWLNFLVGAPLLAGLVLFAVPVVPLIYGATWVPAIPIVVLLAPNMLAGFVTGCIFPVLYATDQSGKALRLFGIWTVLTALCAAVGFWLSQLAGMAAAFSFVTVVVAALVLRSVESVADTKLSSALGLPLLATGAATAVALIAQAAGLLWIIAAAGFVIVYAAIICFAFRKTLIQYTRALLRT